MLTQPDTQLLQWQDLKVRSEVDVVFEIARQKGWEDCELFGRGDMIAQPLESMGWKLIPADLYEYSIPAAGVSRVLQTINAGVRIQGIIIADDERKKEPAPARPEVALPSAETVVTLIAKILLGLFLVAAAIAFAPILILCAVLSAMGVGAAAGDYDYDPKLIILVDDGNGATVWISLLTWYE